MNRKSQDCSFGVGFLNTHKNKEEEKQKKNQMKMRLN